MRADFIVFETNERARDLQRNFEDMVNVGSVPAFGALSFLHLASDRREAIGQSSFDRKPFGPSSPKCSIPPFAFAAAPEFRRTGHDVLLDKAHQHFLVIRNDTEVLGPEKRTFEPLGPDDSANPCRAWQSQ